MGYMKVFKIVMNALNEGVSVCEGYLKAVKGPQRDTNMGDEELKRRAVNDRTMKIL